MWPWMWINYAPNYRLAGTGDWAQQVDTNTVMDALTRSGSTNPAVERKAIDIASYGKQLGWITEVLLGLDAKDDADVQRQAVASLQQLRVVHQKIDALKPVGPAPTAVDLTEAAAMALMKLFEADRAAYEALLAQANTAPQRRTPARRR